MYTDVTAAGYLEHMIHEFQSGLEILEQLEGVTDEEAETIYALGYNLFTYGMYEQAKDVFTKLTAYAPFTSHYWRALGAVNQQLQIYPEAIVGYDMAVATDEADIVSYVYRGESKILSGKIPEGIEDLKAAASIGAQSPEFAAWVVRASMLVELHGS